MKKLLLLAVFAVFGLAISEATAHYRRCGGYYGCRTSCRPACVEECAPVCAAPCAPCKVDKVVEEPCPAIPCCERAVFVREPALVTKHISYTVECPDGCTEREKAVGMMHAGEVWEGGKTIATKKY